MRGRDPADALRAQAGISADQARQALAQVRPFLFTPPGDPVVDLRKFDTLPADLKAVIAGSPLAISATAVAAALAAGADPAELAKLIRAETPGETPQRRPRTRRYS